MVPENDLYDSLIKTSLLLGDGDRQFFSQFKLSQVRYFALLHIEQTPGLSLSELSERLLCTKGNTTRILKSLEADGMIIRETDFRDKRAFQLRLTPDGKQKFERVRSAYRSYNQERFDVLDDGEQMQLKRVLEKLNLDLIRYLDG